jgi:large subunit ribosomal protein L10
MANTKKTSQLDTLMGQLETDSNFALVKYEKTTHIALEGLRKELKTNDSKIKIFKNTLLEKAIRKLSVKNKALNEVVKQAFPLKENSALLALGEDWSKGLSAFHKYTDKEKTLSFKVGLLENQVYKESDLKKIAQLPGKDQLVAKLIGTMKAPMYKFTFAMKFNMQKLVYVLDVKAKQTA